MCQIFVIISSVVILCISTQIPAVSSGESRVAWNKKDWANSCDFRGNDLSNSQTNSDKCYSLCESTNGCTHFTWTGWNGGTCWMKKGPVSPDQAVETSDPGMVCGYISRSPTKSHDNPQPSNSENHNDATNSHPQNIFYICPS